MRTIASNLITFFIFVPFLAVTSSCNKELNEIIPDVCVNFYVDLVYDPLFYDLTAAGNSVIITSTTNNWGACAAGYDDNGIIVYNAGYDYYAFDCTCPNCYKISNLSIAVKIDGVYAVCPECGTNYALPSSGTPTSAGPGRYQLKNYRTNLSGYYLKVWNNY